MEKILIFAALAVVLFLLISKMSGGDRISSEDARAKVAAGAMLLDVRTPAEFGSGHIEGAKNIPVQELDSRLNDVGSKDQTIVVYCRSGARSGRAQSILSANGYEDVHNLGPKSAW